MRIEIGTLRALALAGVLAAAPAAAQDTLAPPEAAPAAVQPEPAQGRIGFSGLTVPKGQVVEGNVVAPFGDVRVEGEVKGNVTVGKGDLVLAPGAVIHGDAVVTGGKLFNEGGRVYGEMRVNSDEDEAAVPADDHGRPVGGQAIGIRHRSPWMDSFGDGVQGLVSTLVLGLILAGLGAALVFYALPQLERVSHVVRTDTLRAGGVGLAANFLSFPAFIVGAVALAVTIIGLPLLIVYFPLFWVALAAACAYGVVAVAHALGERTAERSGSYSPSRHNAYSYTFTGIAILLAPHFVAHLLELTVFLGWLGDLLMILWVIMMWAAATVGFGAVFLTRGGTRPGWPWKPRTPYDPVFDRDPFAGPEPGAAHA